MSTFPAAWPALTTPWLLRGPARPDPRFDAAGADLLRVLRDTSADPRITITRQSRDDIGFREIFVTLDGEQIAILEHGQSVTCEVRPGAHRLRAHNTLFWKTYDVVLRPGDHLRYRAINRAGWGTFSLLVMLGAVPVYLTFEQETGDA